MIRLSAGKLRTIRILSPAGLIAIVFVRDHVHPRAKEAGGGVQTPSRLQAAVAAFRSPHSDTAPERPGGWCKLVLNRIRESQSFKVSDRFPKGRRLWKRF